MSDSCSNRDTRTGFRLEVCNIFFLTEAQCQHLLRKIGVLAISTQGLFDDPVLVEHQMIVAYYAHDYHAQETAQHVEQYLRQIDLDDKVTVSLQPAQWQRRE